MPDENEQIYLAFVNDKWPESPTKLLGVFADEDDAEHVAKTEAMDDDWYNWFVSDHELQHEATKGDETNL